MEAAAKAYFNKDAKDLTMEEGMVLAGLIKNPNGGMYDPSQNLPNAQKRWDYTRDQLHKLHWMTDQKYATIQYPKKGDTSSPRIRWALR